MAAAPRGTAPPRGRGRSSGGAAAERLPGRARLLARLEAEVAHGRTLLLLGPTGAGKSRLLAGLWSRLRRRGVPSALAPQTRALGDVTAALGRAYPEAYDPSLSQRHQRSRLRAAAEVRPGALLLDHVEAPGTATKSLLRSLRGLELGVVLAMDVDHPRDHAAVRALHLSHLEVVVPPLPLSTMATLLDAGLERVVPLHPLRDEDRARLLGLAQGNPGRLELFVGLLTEVRYWHEGRVLADSVAGAALELAMQCRIGNVTAPLPDTIRQ